MQGSTNTRGLLQFLLGMASSRATGQFIGFIAVLTIVWFAGHLVGLNTDNKKLIAMAAVAGAFILFLIARWFWTKRSGDKLVSELANHSAGSQAEIDEIQTKMTDVLQSLKTSHLGAGHRGNAALYALPWYMIIGPSATGKSTLFANSGLHFPYANANEVHVQGFGGTRNCDWWFSDQAVLIDTAGRYTTESSDNKEWMSFLGLLKRNRPKLPINGVMVAISVSDILTSDSETIRLHVKMIRERIQELITELGVIFPVHVVFTKSDLISGFEPFFADLNEKEREQVWGAYLLDESEDQSQDPAELFEVRMEDLYQRLCEQRLSKLARERNVHRKSLIFDFPNQFKSVSLKLTEFVNLLFKENPYQEVPWFAGVYFTSGTQEGTPVERILSGAREKFCAVSLEQKQETITKSYFINRFFNDVVFKLQDLTRGNRRERKIQRWLKGLTVSAMLASIAGITAVLMTSYTMNSILISSGDEKISALVTQAKMSTEPADRLSQFLAVFVQYSTLHAYENDLPWHYMLGVYEGDKTLKAINAVTLQQMQAMITLPIEKSVVEKLQHLSEQWAQLPNMDSKNALRQEYYELLKLHLMFSQYPEKMDVEFAKEKLLSLWVPILGVDLHDEANADLAASLNTVISTYISQFGDSIDKVGALSYWDNNENLVSVARLQLETQPDPATLYRQIVTSKAARKKSLTLKSILKHGNRKYFRSKGRVAYAYTAKGWQEYVYPEIHRVVTVASSGDWVMGTANEQGENLVDNSKVAMLEKAIRSLYFKDYTTQWFGFINSVKVRPFANLSDASIALAKLSSIDGPFVNFMKQVNKNIILNDTPRVEQPVSTDKMAKKDKAAKLAEKVKVALPSIVAKRVPELENRFADLRRFSNGGEQGKISELLQQYIRTLSTIHSDIKTLAGSNDIDARAMEFSQQLLSGEDTQSGLQSSWIVVESQLRALEPETKIALDGLFKSPLQSTFKSIAVVARRQLDVEWNNQVYALYEKGLKGKYPFALQGADAAVDDVAELLNSRSGVLWTFVDEQLSPFLKKRKSKWEERTWNDMGIGFSNELLSGLYKANRVKRSLFSKDSERSEFQFQILPIPQRGIRETYLGFSEQSYRYRNEPEEWRKFKWPGQGTTEVARVYAVDRSGKRASIEKSGPWALLRVLNAAKIKWIKGTEYTASWSFKRKSNKVKYPLSAKFNLKSGRNNGIFSKSTMTSFQLPVSLFENDVSSAKTDLALVK